MKILFFTQHLLCVSRNLLRFRRSFCRLRAHLFAKELSAAAFVLLQKYFLVLFFFISTQCLKMPQNVAFSGFQKLAKIDHFGYFFYQLLTTENANKARFAHSVECDFLCDFQTL